MEAYCLTKSFLFDVKQITCELKPHDYKQLANSKNMILNDSSGFVSQNEDIIAKVDVVEGSGNYAHSGFCIQDAIHGNAGSSNAVYRIARTGTSSALP